MEKLRRVFGQPPFFSVISRYVYFFGFKRSARECGKFGGGQWVCVVGSWEKSKVGVNW